MLLQGFDESVLMGSSEALRVKAAGNAYPVPFMLAVLHPMMVMMKTHVEGEGEKKPLKNKTLLTDEILSTCKKFDLCMEESKDKLQKVVEKKGMKRPASKGQKKAVGRKVMKKPKAKAKAKAKSKAMKAAKAMKAMKKQKYVRMPVAYRFMSSSESS